ncbi:MAG: class I SAM-dependent methyltransferase [Pirellulaceae bacterium]|nr:class I SAM-dependent methyltransferase [Pirellulaceae bacterium]
MLHQRSGSRVQRAIHDGCGGGHRWGVVAMDVRAYNRRAWDGLVEAGNRWTIPVTGDEIQRARDGDWQVVLTPTRPVPRSWFPDLMGAAVLCLASGGGQQGPLLAAAGARVTVLDNSPRQLLQDRMIADREGLSLATVEGDMADLSAFERATFDLIFHPCSNCFVPDVRPVWRECARVLRPGGILLAGFSNPVRYLFDIDDMETGNLVVRHSIPYSDATDLSETDRQRIILDQGEPLEFGHALEHQIGGQLDAGFAITEFYEDRYDDPVADPLSKYLPTFVATRAVRTASVRV